MSGSLDAPPPSPPHSPAKIGRLQRQQHPPPQPVGAPLQQVNSCSSKGLVRSPLPSATGSSTSISPPRRAAAARAASRTLCRQAGCWLALRRPPTSARAAGSKSCCDATELSGVQAPYKTPSIARSGGTPVSEPGTPTCDVPEPSIKSTEHFPFLSSPLELTRRCVENENIFTYEINCGSLFVWGSLSLTRLLGRFPESRHLRSPFHEF